jgi:hypothetical protein
MMRAPAQIPPVKTMTGAMCQILWHACRRESPAVTAMLMYTPTGNYEVQVAFGTVALQRVSFFSAVVAVERAEHLLTELEARGYQRQRRDKRPTRRSC